jgi:transposase
MGDSSDEVISGEIVFPDRGRAGGTGEYTRHGSRRRTSYADEDTIAAVIADRAKGMGLRAVAAKWRCSPETVRRWCGEDIEAHKLADVDKVRAEVAQQLATVRREAWAMFEAGKDLGRADIMKDALTRVESSAMATAKLTGAIRPVKIDVMHTAVTEAERELQEMINEARARTAAEEAAVIASANADPDL